MPIIITYVEFTNRSTKQSTSATLDYAEWLRDGNVEYSHADPNSDIDSEGGEVDGIPADVRQAIAKLVVEAE